MTLFNVTQFRGQSGGDDIPQIVHRRDLSGGINNRQYSANLSEKQLSLLQNVDIIIPGKMVQRAGITEFEDIGDNNAGTGAFAFEPNGYTNALVVTHGTDLEYADVGGSFANAKSDFTTGLLTNFCRIYKSGANDVMMVCNGTDDFEEFDPNGWSSTTLTDDGDDAPPITTAFCNFRQRLWCLKNERLYWSDASSSDYSAAFDQATNWFHIPCGEEVAAVPIRDQGLFCFGKESTWAINPSVTPVATDKPEKWLDIGCAAAKSAKVVGDDIYFLAKDGIRAVKRSAQDQMQLGASFPLSYVLKDEIDSINWAHAHKSSAVWFDNKYLIAIPVDGSTYNNKILCFYPAINAWTVFTGWNVADWIKIDWNGEERLYYIDSTDDVVYRAFSGTDDAGAAIEYDLQTRAEDLNSPMQWKHGGEISTRFLSGGGLATVYVNMDEQGWVSIGTVDTTGNAVTFPTEFPIIFYNEAVITGKFHLDPTDVRWKEIKVRVYNNTTDDLTLLSYSVVAFPEPYEHEDSSSASVQLGTGYGAGGYGE